MDKADSKFEMSNVKKAPEDENLRKLSLNDSIDPSYTNLVLPYRVICRQRYHKAGVEQRKQFAKEIRDHALLQVRALDGVKIHREFLDPVITPPHPGEIIKLTEKQKRRLEEIMATNY